jgi:hypothetical protein
MRKPNIPGDADRRMDHRFGNYCNVTKITQGNQPRPYTAGVTMNSAILAEIYPHFAKFNAAHDLRKPRRNQAQRRRGRTELELNGLRREYGGQRPVTLRKSIQRRPRIYIDRRSRTSAPPVLDWWRFCLPRSPAVANAKWAIELQCESIGKMNLVHLSQY